MPSAKQKPLTKAELKRLVRDQFPFRFRRNKGGKVHRGVLGTATLKMETVQTMTEGATMSSCHYVRGLVLYSACMNIREMVRMEHNPKRFMQPTRDAVSCKHCLRGLR